MLNFTIFDPIVGLTVNTDNSRFNKMNKSSATKTDHNAKKNVRMYII